MPDGPRALSTPTFRPRRRRRKQQQRSGETQSGDGIKHRRIASEFVEHVAGHKRRQCADTGLNRKPQPDHRWISFQSEIIHRRAHHRHQRCAPSESQQDGERIKIRRAGGMQYQNRSQSKRGHRECPNVARLNAVAKARQQFADQRRDRKNRHRHCSLGRRMPQVFQMHHAVGLNQ